MSTYFASKTCLITLIATASLALSACGGGGGGGTTTTITPPSGGTPAPANPVTKLPAPPAPPDGPSYHPENQGWFLSWSDEFDGDTLDRGKWEVEESCWGGGNNERQCYTDRDLNVEVINGLLRLMAYPEEYTGFELGQEHSNRGAQVTQSYTSGKVRTRELASWTYGRFEARISLPQGQGTWPAFWMLPSDSVYGTWPLSGEIDIMESVNLGAACSDCEGSSTENRSTGAIHFGSPYPNNTFVGGRNTLPGGADGVSAYHVFAVEWGEGRINWFVDDILFDTKTADDWFTDGVSKAENVNAPFDQAFYLILNLAVGGNYPENTNERRFEPDSFPNQLLIDWVRVYQCDFDNAPSQSCLQDGP